MCDFGWNGLGWIAVALALITLFHTNGDGCGCQNNGGTVGGGCGGCLGNCGGCR
ncbi:MAG: hypothetical protein II953_05715 [Clostridia bacterium]|jgi:hypothetical protein|nr:hypothetical protein [Clostridia bacterium]MBQ3859642.1 hypothetical protein [Clostridia bacterium]MBQ3954327.1 hypothetical protein [Clostridia bacterium]MBQ5355706.1 hypothetical protein [Clostridia bacterium]